MTAVVLIVAAVVSSVVLGFIVRRLTQEPPAAPVMPCDLCEEAEATVHLTETFDDAEEAEFGGGGTVMRADYCQPCAESLGVG